MRAKTKKSLVLLAIGFIICVIFSLPVHAASFHSKCWVPYNIYEAGEWVTGLNITTDYTNEVLTILFFNKTTLYATVSLPLSPAEDGRFWTGTPQQLLAKLASPPPFESPTLLLITSEKGVFSVTQFIMNINYVQGFGHQTFHSFPYANTWPYTIADQPPPVMLETPVVTESSRVMLPE